MKGKLKLLPQIILMGAVLVGQQAFAVDKQPSKTIEVYLLNNDAAKHGIGDKIGTITFSDSTTGLHIGPNLKELPEGPHGFHIHENPSCDGQEKEGKWEPASAAGGHLDPQHTGHHLGPNGHGHLGDLPVLDVNKQGEAKTATTAKRLKLAEIEGHSVMIHQGPDNYSDVPPMGGGGARIACGVIKK